MARAVVVGVVGARGGAGASTVVAALAVAGVARGLGVVLVDGQHTGAGVDVLLGVEEQPGLRWADLQDARGDVDASRLLGLLPRWSGAYVLSADRERRLGHPDDVEHDVLRALGSATGLVVLDLPAGRLLRHVGSCDVVVVVARCDTLSVAGALAVRAALDASSGPGGGVPVGLVCRGTAVGRLTAHDVAAAVGVALWGELLSDRTMAGAVEGGAGPTVRLPRGARGRGAARTSLGGVACAVLDHALAVAGSQVGR